MTITDGERRFWAGVENAERFFMGEAPVQKALKKLSEALEREHIPYAIAGAMALNEHGYHRVTVDVNIIVTRESLAVIKARLVGRGYLEKFPGSKSLKDTEYGVSIDVILAGDFPGDGKPKAVSFPDPAKIAVHRGTASFLPLAKLVELKLASGISAPHRLKDLADVLELVRAAGLPESLADQLDPSVREKYRELWAAAQTRDPE